MTIGKFRCGECGEDVTGMARERVAYHENRHADTPPDPEATLVLTSFEAQCPKCGAIMCFVRLGEDAGKAGMPGLYKGMYALVTLEDKACAGAFLRETLSFLY